MTEPEVKDDHVHEAQPQEQTESPDKPIEMPKAEPPKSQTDWDKFEKMDESSYDYLESEYDHKAFLLNTKFRDKDVFKLHDLVVKELSLSVLPDSELALIYSVKMDCVEEWLSMGMTQLAKRRLSHMLFRLRLNTSIEGSELVLQHGTSAVSMSMNREEREREGIPDPDAPQGTQMKAPRFSLLKKLMNKKMMR